MDDALRKKDEAKLSEEERIYKRAIEAWGKFKQDTPLQFHSPCYYDAKHMQLWSATNPGVVKLRVDHKAESTRRVRFDRKDVEQEIRRLADQAAAHWPALREVFALIRAEGWHYTESATKRERTLSVVAETVGEFLVHGPAGAPSAEALADFHRYLAERRKRGIRPGTEDDWQAATGQKTPRFDNRIVEDCALLDGLRVCGVAVRFDKKTNAAHPDSLLYAEVTFLMKLKNLRVEGRPSYPMLTADEIRKLWKIALGDVEAINLQKIESDIRKRKPDAEDFMGAKAKKELKEFQDERAEKRKNARKMAAKGGTTGRMAGLKYELLENAGQQVPVLRAGLLRSQT